jgi:hypothetical protein
MEHCLTNSEDTKNKSELTPHHKRMGRNWLDLCVICCWDNFTYITAIRSVCQQNMVFFLINLVGYNF